MKNTTLDQLPSYLWPDLSPVIRLYVVVDDQGRHGIAHTDPVYHPNVLFAHPIHLPGRVVQSGAAYLTNTAWHKEGDTYTGVWCDYDGPVSPQNIPDELVRRITIVDDLGYHLPDKWADKALADSDQPGHWDYGATLGKIGGERPIKGQSHDEMSIPEAEAYAAEVEEPVPARTIRYAAKNGFISGARKVGRDWLIPYDGFEHYLANRPKPGPK